MAVTAFAVAFVPYFFDCVHGFGLALVHFIHQDGIHLFAIFHALFGYLQGFVEKVVLAGDNIYKIADASRRMPFVIEMDIAFPLFIDTCPAMSKPTL